MKKNLFLRSYPIFENIQEILSFSFLMGIVVSVLLLIFQPFGIHSFQQINTLACLGFGAVTSIVLLISLLLIYSSRGWIYNDNQWNVWKQLLLTLLVLVEISYGNWLLLRSLSLHNGSEIVPFHTIISYTLTISIGPLVVGILYFEKILRKHNSDLAQKTNQGLPSKARDVESITIMIEREEVIFQRNDLLYVMTEGNYLKIILSSASTLVIPPLIRMTLNDLALQFKPFQNIYRCHRSWLVNLNKVESVSGNAAGYRLKIGEDGKIIPVSRNESAVVLDKLSSI